MDNVDRGTHVKVMAVGMWDFFCLDACQVYLHTLALHNVNVVL